ncbi:MAG TPA: maleylpyruvate isomerase family mycothiol-dependent enzyme [Streptosporangiaceae bacterium]|nr:maleylpyruvate isomerase family mycothiol-dependent enzyme [Streptosporangiaceae bacterium]
MTPADDRDLPVLPAGLRERVLAASLRARDAGRPEPDAPLISPVEAFSRAASAFYAVLCFLDDEGWRTPVLRGLDVQGLVGHLIGVEEDVHRALAGDPAVADAEHVESTQATALDQAARRPAQTRTDWRRAVDRTLDLVRPADARPRVAVHGLRMPVGALLVVRAFELWTHENDIRQAVGWAPSVPDPSTLRLMTDLAARLLPHAGAALPEPVDVRLVLTGPGGGTWDVTMGGPSPAAPSGESPAAPPGESPAASPGPSPAAAAVAIVTDAVGFCRLAANRATPDDLDVDVTGDPARAAAVLAAATTLALD